MEYLKTLNKTQKEAVQCIEGPVLIIAGPGSGKTRVLTYRIAHLIQKGVDPFNILALTFTNKAAKEMKNRIEQIAGTEARNLWIGTFHAVFARILRVEADKLGYPPNFTIYDTTDSKSLIKSIIKEKNLPKDLYKPNIVYNRISKAKNSLISPKDYQKHIDLQSEDEVSGRSKMGEVYALYNKRCFKAGAMDFDDLLLKMHDLLSSFPEVLYKYQHQFKYILIDEYQDTNYTQYVIIKKLSDVFQNICVVGDDAQSIYSFRGANIQNILKFEQDYPELAVFKLEQNYRSTKAIVNVANNIIAKNTSQLAKTIWTNNMAGDNIKVIKALTDNEEGRLVGNTIFEERLRNHNKDSDFAILYRTNAQSRVFEEALRKLNIPYKVYGGMSFYQRKEVKDLLAYLRITVNPHDEESLKRVINYPARGIGKGTIEKIIVLAGDNDTSLWEIMKNIMKSDLNARAKSAVENFVTKIKSFMAMLNSHNAYDIAEHIAKQTNILKELYDDKSIEGVSRYENIQELLNSIKEFTVDDNSNEANTEKNLSGYLQEVSLITSLDTDDEEKEKVSLMTIHSAKGLEFPHVYVVGLEENLFPSYLSLNTRDELEEERRLFYVAVTRAKDKATFSYALNRYRFGTLTSSSPSRFIADIDPELLYRPILKKQKKETQYQPVTSTTVVRKRNNTNAVIEHFVPDDISTLQTGMNIKHNRFGQGKILNIEGNAESKIATIFFPNIGQKKIMLKYAKLKVLN